MFASGTCTSYDPYFALTGNVPYPARTFADVIAAWSSKLGAPSELDPSIPAALDDLVLSLLSVEPALRPHSAFDVMQQLAAIADIPHHESDEVSRAYLATPTLVGRDEALDAFRRRLLAARQSRSKAWLLEGRSGSGRSRLLDACILEAKSLGFNALRATSTDPERPYATARALCQQLVEALPSEACRLAPELFQKAAGADAPSLGAQSLRDFADPSLQSETLSRSIARLFWRTSGTRPLLIAVDDAHNIDSRTAAVLASLLDQADRGRMFVILTRTDESASAPTRPSALATTDCSIRPAAKGYARASRGSPCRFRPSRAPACSRRTTAAPYTGAWRKR